MNVIRAASATLKNPLVAMRYADRSRRWMVGERHTRASALAWLHPELFRRGRSCTRSRHGAPYWSTARPQAFDGHCRLCGARGHCAARSRACVLASTLTHTSHVLAMILAALMSSTIVSTSSPCGSDRHRASPRAKSRVRQSLHAPRRAHAGSNLPGPSGRKGTSSHADA